MDDFFTLQIHDKNDVKKYNPQVLAFVGDAVFTLFVRHKMVNENSVKSGELHKLTTAYVKASGQSDITSLILPMLTQDEIDVFKRGRNYKTHSIAKNSKVTDYKRATGFEAVLGYLYLSGQKERLNEILAVLDEDRG